MCQRYVVPDQPAVEREFLPATAWWRFEAKFNVSAEQTVPAVRVHDSHSEGVMMRWGLIPSWVEGTPQGPARTWVLAHRLERSKGCSAAWLNGQRCIVPMAGFYCWQLTADGYRQPFYVRLTDRAVFGVAAVWDRWVSDEDDVIESCSIICVTANELISELAGPLGGMPAILRRRDYDIWLRGTADQAREALQPYRTDWMHAYPVSPRINSIAVDDPALIRVAN